MMLNSNNIGGYVAGDRKSEDGSIKYHSLSIGTDYENLRADEGENPYSAIPVDIGTQSNQTHFDYYARNIGNGTRDTRDSGHGSDSENVTQFSGNQNNDYETTVECGAMVLEGAEICKKRLENMQSRSRMPISLGSESLNLTVMNSVNANPRRESANKNVRACFLIQQLEFNLRNLAIQ